MSSSIPAFYNGGLVNIWVEDPMTRAYFQAAWPEEPFHYLVAGGRAGAEAMARQAVADGLPVSVFAIVDRDLGDDNEPKWGDSNWQDVVFRPRVLEVENFLLDEVALEVAPSNAVRMSRAEILAEFQRRADDLKWWMTCKMAIDEINRLRNQGFPSDKLARKFGGGVGVQSEDDAVSLLRGCDWVKMTVPSTVAATDETSLRAQVRRAHAEVERWLNGEDWRERFSGKELFGWVYGQVCSAGRGRSPASIETLAAEMGALQVNMNRVHPSLTALKAVIHRRARV